MRTRLRLICSGVAPISRANWVSVRSLLGIRLSRPNSSGRMSWREAREESMTLTPSASSVFLAGKLSGIRIGISASCEVLSRKRFRQARTHLLRCALSHSRLDCRCDEIDELVAFTHHGQVGSFQNLAELISQRLVARQADRKSVV